MNDKIVNKIIKQGKVKWRDCEWLQPDNLKKYSDSQWKKLKTSLIKNGFISPLILWENKGTNYILDAHHRQKALKEIEEIDGVIIPDQLPAIWVDCKNKKEAKKAILIYNSHYADIVQDNLNDWIKDLDLEELKNEVDIIGIDYDFECGIDEDEKIDNDNEYLNLKLSFKSIEDKIKFVNFLDEIGNYEKKISTKLINYILKLREMVSDEESI